MVALVRDIITNEPSAIHRTALTIDGRKLDRPKLLGPSAGGAIKLSSDYVTNELTIAEGIETTLSAMILGFEPGMVRDRCRRHHEIPGDCPGSSGSPSSSTTTRAGPARRPPRNAWRAGKRQGCAPAA